MDIVGIFDLDAIVVIGGDGSLRGARDISKRASGHRDPGQ